MKHTKKNRKTKNDFPPLTPKQQYYLERDQQRRRLAQKKARNTPPPPPSYPPPPKRTPPSRSLPTPKKTKPKPKAQKAVKIHPKKREIKKPVRKVVPGESLDAIIERKYEEHKKATVPNNALEEPVLFPSQVITNILPTPNPQSTPYRDERDAPAARFEATHDYVADPRWTDDQDEVSFTAGDEILSVRETDEPGWVIGVVKRTGMEGMIPSNYMIETTKRKIEKKPKKTIKKKINTVIKKKTHKKYSKYPSNEIRAAALAKAAAAFSRGPKYLKYFPGYGKRPYHAPKRR
jgi:hypothetical protein